MKNLTFKQLKIILVIFAMVLSGSMYAGSNNGNSSNSNKSDVEIFFNFIIDFFKNKKSKNNNGHTPHGKPTKGKPTKGKPTGDSIPIDGGLSILLLGAAAFGAKKLHDNNDKN